MAGGPEETSALEATQAVVRDDLFDPRGTSFDPGAIIEAGRYRIESLLGRGGMAEVYRATDTLLDRAVAIKVMHDGVRDESAERRFAEEARVLGGLTHHGLVTVYDAGTSGGRPYIVMELVEGSSLASVLSEQVVDEAWARVIVAEIADALAVVHATEVIHRDVKPANILVGVDGSAMLSDFGIAKIASEIGQYTATGAAIGTVSYLAPEQVSGGDPSTAIDIYALGLVLLELLTGEKTFRGTVAEAAVARLAGLPDIPERVTEDLRVLILEMTVSNRRNGRRPKMLLGGCGPRPTSRRRSADQGKRDGRGPEARSTRLPGR